VAEIDERIDKEMEIWKAEGCPHPPGRWVMTLMNDALN